jgi:hypothetical protein
MLIDGGSGRRAGLPEGLADRLDRQPVHDRRFDLVVCTHIDTDHIGGLLHLFTRPPEGFHAEEVWFNCRDHLLPADRLGPRHGDRLAELLRGQGVAWNTRTGGGAVVVPDDGTPPVFHFPGLVLTLLSPTWKNLRKLRDEWPEPAALPTEPSPPDLLGDLDDLDTFDDQDEFDDLSALSDLDRPGQDDSAISWQQLADGAGYERDRSAPNGSSIAFCAEDTTGARVLFGADAHAETLVEALVGLGSGRPYPVDLCKVPHHGSARNLSPAFLEALDCRHWLISTHGGRTLPRRAHETRYRPGEGAHPSLRAMAKILVRPGARSTLWFNHRVPSTEHYADASVASAHGCDAVYPPPGTEGITVLVDKGRVTRDPSV